MSPEIQAAIDRLKKLRRNHHPRVVYSSEQEKSLLTYADINKRVQEDERVVLEAYLETAVGNDVYDGNEPWTDEWLESVGFAPEKINGWALELLSPEPNAEAFKLWLDHDCHASLVQYPDHVTITTTLYKTKGEVRRLCDSLGRRLEG